MDRVDSSSPKQIADAIKTVNQTPSLRNQVGATILWDLYDAPNHTLSRAEIEAKHGDVLDLHFGWYCRRVAEELGDENPPAFALTNHLIENGKPQVLTLKPSVIAAMPPRKK
jgi:hypothetical protein